MKSIGDCYCVCHTPVSSRAWCEHCQGDNEVTRSWIPDFVPAIQGALRTTIDAHGPIDKQWIASASKRINAAIRQQLRENLRRGQRERA